MKNYFVSGSYNVTCDVCSKKIKATEAKLRWDGFLVCADDFEQRHPQDFVKAKTDKITVPIARPIPALVYTPVTYINMYVDGGYIDDYYYYVSDPQL